MGAANRQQTSRRLVVGYARCQTPSRGCTRLWRHYLDTWCADNGYRLTLAVLDQGATHDHTPPGLSAVLDIARLPEVHAVVIPLVTHLADNPQLAQQRADDIRRTGARLLIILPPPADHGTGRA